MEKNAEEEFVRDRHYSGLVRGETDRHSSGFWRKEGSFERLPDHVYDPLLLATRARVHRASPSSLFFSPFSGTAIPVPTAHFSRRETETRPSIFVFSFFTVESEIASGYRGRSESKNEARNRGTTGRLVAVPGKGNGENE